MSIQTLPQVIFDALRQPRERAFSERRGNVELTILSSDAMRARIVAVAYALRAQGCERGDRVALISSNRLDWIAADLAIFAAGCISVPIFITSASDQLAYILRECAPKLIFVETKQEELRVSSLAPPGTMFVHFDGEGAGSLSAFETQGASARACDPQLLERVGAELEPHDPAVLLYTSGTTGEPKGVLLSHGNVVSNAVAAWTYGLGKIGSDKVVLSVLPYAHSMEHTNMIGAIVTGLEYHVTVPERLLADLREVRPHVMAVVPRLLERMLAGIRARASEAGGLRAALVSWALDIARAHGKAAFNGSSGGAALRLQYALAQRLVLRKIRPALGLDRLIHCVSGSAPLHPDVAFTFAGLGIAICEGYGQTETSPVVSVNRALDNRLGTVGKPLPGVEVRIASDGEVLVRGPNVMLGYYRNAESPFTPDGWLMTGDIGTLDADGYLSITDRKKELFKTSGGKYIAPTRVEAALGRSPYFNQVVLVGHGRPHPAALLALNWPLVRKDLGIGDEVLDAMLATHPKVQKLARAEVRGCTKDLASFEQVRYFAILPRELTMENGEISQTLKVKRRVVENKYAALVEKAYSDAFIG